MRRAFFGAAGMVLAFLISGIAYSETNEAQPAAPAHADQAGSAAVSAPTTGSSVVERDKKRYSNKKRAADKRAAEMKKGTRAGQPAKRGTSVVERDRQRYDIQKRAADKRAEEMKKNAQDNNAPGQVQQSPK